MRGYVLDGGGLEDSENTLDSFFTTNKEKVFWQIGNDMLLRELKMNLDIGQLTPSGVPC